MSFLTASSISQIARSGYDKLQSSSFKRKQQFSRFVGNKGFKPMNFKPIGLSSKSRNTLANLRSSSDAFLQGLYDIADYQLTQTTQNTVNQINERLSEELFAQLDAQELKSQNLISTAGSIFDTTV